jgi:hypothetical protein
LKSAGQVKWRQNEVYRPKSRVSLARTKIADRVRR